MMFAIAEKTQRTMSRFLRGKAAIVLSLGLLSVTSSALAKTDLETCYGDEIEISVVGFHPTETNDGRVIIALPTVLNWIINLRGNGRLNELPCQAEPITNFRSAVALSVPKEVRLSMDHIPINIGRIDIHGNSTDNRGTYRLDSAAKLIREKGVPVENGFKAFLYPRSGRSHEPKHMGLYEFPPSHKSPTGDPVYRRCSTWSCDGEYGFLERIKVLYIFNNNEDDLSKWVSQDALFQNLINSWIRIGGN